MEDRLPPDWGRTWATVKEEDDGKWPPPPRWGCLASAATPACAECDREDLEDEEDEGKVSKPPDNLDIFLGKLLYKGTHGSTVELVAQWLERIDVLGCPRKQEGQCRMPQHWCQQQMQRFQQASLQKHPSSWRHADTRMRTEFCLRNHCVPCMGPGSGQLNVAGNYPCASLPYSVQRPSADGWKLR